MNSKKIAKQLRDMGYTLGKDIFGWIVIANDTGMEWKFPTLGGVKRFMASR